MKLTPLQQYLILGAMVLAAILFGYYQYLWKPVNQEIVKLTATRDQKQKDLDEAKRIVARYAEFKKQAATVQRELEWFESRIPKKLETTRFVQALNSIQQSSRVKFTSLTFPTSKPAAGAPYNEMSADVRFTTDFQGLLTFLYRMSLAEVYMVADSLNLVRMQGAENETLTAQMMVKGVLSK